MAAEEVIPDWEEIPEVMQGGIRRPAYTDETLAEALWNGVDPAGRKFDPIMPRYLLDPPDMEVLVYYLKHLSDAPSPGVTDDTLHLATVVSSDLPARSRQAMLSALQGYVESQQSRSRQQHRRARKSAFYQREMYTGYRQLKLHVWELEGPPATWGRQLENYYRQEPVFAMIGGMVTGQWAPIHAFCERERIPCIFPLTEQPVLSENDWYTLYFSKGPYQEGEGAARYLRSQADPGPPPRIVQVFRNDPAGRALARGFEATWRRFGFPAPENRMLRPGEPVGNFLRNQPIASGEATVLLWLGPEAYPLLESWSSTGAAPPVFLPASLLGDKLTDLPEAARPTTYIAYPFRLPADAARINKVVRIWLKARKIPVTDLAIQARMYAATWQLSSALMMMKNNFYRDYFLDIFDMMNDQDYAVAAYPRLTFGQGQRYAAKGCYILQLGPGEQPELIVRSDWVSH
jgi:ABC-type branched-subunit amino acid transport system substrate-binding protein